MLRNIIFIFLLFSGSTHAYLCMNTLTGETFKSGNQDLVVFLDSDIQAGENIFANVGDYISCKNEIPDQYTDFLDLQTPNAIIPGSAVQGLGLDGGVYINGQRFRAGQTNGPFNVFTLTDGDYHPVDIDVYFEVTQAVGPYVEINPGDELMVLRLNFHSLPVESDFDYSWRIIAGNRAILATGTCEIDNGAPIEVNFGDVGKKKISTGANSALSTVRVDKTISFDCDNPGIDMNIDIHLSATPLSFSNDGFATSTSGLGVVMYHDGNIVPPFGKFPSRLTGGLGSEDLSFSLIKTANPGPGDLAEGPFTAQGSLIISVQ
ncbi:fimbrial protein [uncultured Cedecea sp.]|uniref:fimbrial protein n=1 Tax=uncultured Cedecea sp. TaxID=988762 RepID=UPI00260D09F6|nr:fimbrial protein [uncultured Cedecea sp.]